MERGQYRGADSRLRIGDCEGMASISRILGRQTRPAWNSLEAAALSEPNADALLQVPDKQEHCASE